MNLLKHGFPKKPEGGNYWRQAVFYKLLFDRQRDKSKELRELNFCLLNRTIKKNLM